MRILSIVLFLVFIMEIVGCADYSSKPTNFESGFFQVDFLTIHTTDGYQKLRERDRFGELTLEKLHSSIAEFYKGEFVMHEFVHVEFSGEMTVKGSLHICGSFATFELGDTIFPPFAGEYFTGCISDNHSFFRIVNMDYIVELFGSYQKESDIQHITINDVIVRISGYTIKGNRRDEGNRWATAEEIILTG